MRNADWRSATVSSLKSRVKILSTSPILAVVAGTGHPICARNTIIATCDFWKKSGKNSASLLFKVTLPACRRGQTLPFSAMDVSLNTFSAPKTKKLTALELFSEFQFCLRFRSRILKSQGHFGLAVCKGLNTGVFWGFSWKFYGKRPRVWQ